MSFLALLIVPFALSLAQEPPEPSGADALIEQAWAVLPDYDGEPHPLLSAEQGRQVHAAAHLLETAVDLTPGHLRALWSLGFAEFLLAEDNRSRGASQVADVHYRRCMAALSRAIERHPNDPWAFFSRGVARARFDDFAGAADDLDATINTAEWIMANRKPAGRAGWLRRQALELLPDVHVGLKQYGEARALLHEIHAEFSDDSRPLLLALVDTHLRQRDFGGARSVLDELVETFPDDARSHRLLGLLQGLRGDQRAAHGHLTEALAREAEPRVSTLRWLTIVATDETRADAEAQLDAIVATPPAGASTWELTLAHLLLGEGDVEAFLDEQRVEKQRRMDAGQAFAEHMLSAWFHAGLRWERDAAAAEDDTTREALLASARQAYAAALGYAASPMGWTWEGAYAQRRLAAPGSP